MCQQLFDFVCLINKLWVDMENDYRQINGEMGDKNSIKHSVNCDLEKGPTELYTSRLSRLKTITQRQIMFFLYESMKLREIHGFHD